LIDDLGIDSLRALDLLLLLEDRTGVRPLPIDDWFQSAPNSAMFTVAAMVSAIETLKLKRAND
jgi:acyl carrier protein